MEQGKKNSAPALVRGLRVLELIAGSESRHSLTTVASSLGIAMSSAHSVCTTLMNEGYLERARDGTFDLTLRIVDLARSKIESYSLVDHFHRVCEEIPLIRENGATMSVLEGPDVYFIAARNSPKPLGVTFKVGSRMPACCMASGRALLSRLTDDEVRALYPQEELPQLTRDHPARRSQLLTMLAEARRDGYSREIKGTRPHMCSYGALVASPNGKTVAGVAITMYEGDLTPAVEQEAIASIRDLASTLSHLGDILG